MKPRRYGVSREVASNSGGRGVVRRFGVPSQPEVHECGVAALKLRAAVGLQAIEDGRRGRQVHAAAALAKLGKRPRAGSVVGVGDRLDDCEGRGHSIGSSSGSRSTEASMPPRKLP